MSNKEEKDKLEAYARDKFGVELDKRKSLKSLQEEVEALENPNEETVQEEVKQELPQEVESVEPKETAQRRADRIWLGQSPNLSNTERKTRIYKALEKLGYPEPEIMRVEFPA